MSEDDGVDCFAVGSDDDGWLRVMVMNGRLKMMGL